MNRVRPGLIPNFAALNRSNKLANCTLGMNTAEEKLDIPKLLDPEEFCHSDVDELSVMTYLSYFCTLANSHLLKWVQATIPHRNIKNFTTDWNDGISFACLLEALNPGGFPDCLKLNPQNAIDNLAKGMKLADEQLGIKPVLKPAEMADPHVDELNIVTYLSRFQNAKPIPQPNAISCSGDGLFKAIVGKTATFEVDISKGGTGNLVIEIVGSGKKINADIKPKAGQQSILVVNYVPESSGKISIKVQWSGTEIPSSPYSVNVVDPKGFSLSGPQISGRECARVGKLVKMEVKGMSEASQVEVTIQLSSGGTEQAKVVPISKGLAECSYTPRKVGTDKVTAKIAGMTIPGSPFSIKVIDPTKLSVTLREPAPGKPLLITEKATIVVTSSEGSVDGVVAELSWPKGAQEISLKDQGKGSSIGTVTPIVIGKQEIRVKCGSEDIKGSPIVLQVSDPSKCVFINSLPKFLHVGKPETVDLSVQGAGQGNLQTKSSEVGVLVVDSTKGPGSEKYSVKFTPKKVGEATVNIDWNGMGVGKMPHKISVCDASKCSAYGPGLTSGKGKIKEVFEFTVQAKEAGNGELKVVPKGPKTVYVADIKKNPDGTYKVMFTSFELGVHSIEITWAGEKIPNSPYKIDFLKAAAANTFTVTGEGLKKAVALTTAKCMIIGPESGLISNGTLKIIISGNGKESVPVSKSEFNPKSGKPMVFASDNSNGSYAVEYAVPAAGKYSLSITSDGEHVPGSPFQVNVLPAPDASKCRAYGLAFDDPTSLVVSRSIEFKVDSTNAGTGELTVTAKDKNSANVPVFLAEDKSTQTKKIHTVKIDMKAQGVYEIEVKWSGQHIPKSPFKFDISDPKAVIFLDLPNPSEYIARKGEAISFSVDTRKAGSGELKAMAKLDGGKTVDFGQKKNPDGTVKLVYVPTMEAKLELILTFCGVNILVTPWIVDVTDPSAFKVIPPKESGKQNEFVKFVITGMTKKHSKNVMITAKNKSHDATVKIEDTDKGQSIAQFIAKDIGEYTVEVKAAKKHIDGSPFKCLVANPDGCSIKGEIPRVIPIGVTKEFTVNISKSGPGELTFECIGEGNVTSRCLSCTISKKGLVKVKGESCGKCTFSLKFAGYIIPSMPVEIISTDPKKCFFTCKEIKDGPFRTNQSATIEIDTSNGGKCPPEVSIKGQKSGYDVDLKTIMPGKYSATFTPWQDGSNTLRITVGGVDITGSPKKFESLKPLDASKVTISGPGLKRAIANRKNEVTVYARESMLIDKGMLGIAFSNGSGCKLEVRDNQNGTYNVSFVPKSTETLKLSITGEGKEIAGSPFNIDVLPEPDASKCKIRNLSGDDMFSDSSNGYHLSKTPFELRVYTTEAGSGSLTVSGKAPNNSPIRIFTNDEKDNGDSITYIKFDPTLDGIYTLSLKWDGKELPGSPYSIRVVDPTKCVSETSFPSFIRIGEKVTYKVETGQAGAGELYVSSSGPEISSSVSRVENGTFIVTLEAVKLGSATIDIKFGRFNLPGSPYTLPVCDPSKCVSNFKTGKFNSGKTFKFTINTKGCGTGKLQVVSSKKGTSVIRNPQDSLWEVSFTPKEIGEYILKILWGNWEIPGSPITFFVYDPASVKITGLPDPDDMLIMGKPVSFTLDLSEAGEGDFSCKTRTSDGIEEDVSREETDANSNLSSLSFVPKKPGKVTLIMEFNGMDILPKPYIYDVPDPTKFKVTPPKGIGRQKEYVKFGITGVDEETELDITAVHPNHNATVKTEKGPDSSTIIARMTPKEIGDYHVEVKHVGQHIDGSPFVIQVCNPDACKFIGGLPNVIQVGVEPNIRIDNSEAGPGELTFETEILSGIEDASSSNEGEENKWIISLQEGIGKIRVTAKWAGYNIPSSPFTLTFVDSERVKWACEALDKDDILKQGELMTILIDGTDAGETVPEVIAIGPEAEYAGKVSDNKNGTYTISLNPWQIGKNEVRILWGGHPIPDTPIFFEVIKNIDTRAITVSGEGLTKAIAKTETVLFINAIESGLIEQGLLKVKFDEDKEVPPCVLTDEGNGIYKLCFVLLKEGTYSLIVMYDDEHILNSPFSINVSGAPNAEKCQIFGDAIDKTPALFISNDPVKFCIDTSEAGSGSLSILATQPNGKPIRVYTVDEDDTHHLKFDPVLIGHYKVEVKWGGKDIPGSPFDFNVVDPSKCIVKGLPPDGDRVDSSEPLTFTVQMKDVGRCSPEVVFDVKGELTVLDNPEPSDEVYSYTYLPKSFGKVSIIVKIAGVHVHGSPFRFTIVDPNKYSISGFNLKGDYALVCEPVTIEITGRGSEGDELAVTAHGPTADLNVDTIQRDEDTYEASFVPIEPGSYEVFVEFSGHHVHGSPFTIKVADPSKCQILGGSLSILQVDDSDEMTVKTRGAGEGSLKAFVKNEDEENPAVKCEVKDLGLDTYSIILTGRRIGKASVDLQWAGYTIPHCPFLSNVCDASKCKAYGEVLDKKRGKAGTAITFTVETEGAGAGKLIVSAKGPSAQYTINVIEIRESVYEVSFTPWEIGEHKIGVIWGKANIPNSPFVVMVGSPLEMETCNATGDGLKHAIAGQKASFTIICSEVGLLDKNVLKVTVMGITSHAEATITDNNNGCYLVEYVAPSPGAYVASVLFHDRQIPGSPFKVTVDSGPDASKCKAYGPALHPNTLAIAGTPLEFFVDTSDAGCGNLRVYIQGPNDYKPKVFMADDDKGVFSIKFDAMKPGKYLVAAVWSDKHIPNSPFRIRVHPAANASKVKAFGPGLLDSFMGTPGQFTIETKNAGIGTLLIRIHGLKDSFKIEARSLSENDTRTLICTYNPKLVGEYTVFIRWSGVHIPGSPFTIHIKQKPG